MEPYFSNVSIFFLYSTAIVNTFVTQETLQLSIVSGTFRVKRATDGTQLCARDNPSVVYNSSQFEKPPVSPGCVPESVLCAWKCKTDENCISFNWKNDQQLCEVFYFVPLSFGFVAGCDFHEVRKLFDGLVLECVATCILLFANELIATVLSNFNLS